MSLDEKQLEQISKKERAENKIKAIYEKVLAEKIAKRKSDIEERLELKRLEGGL